MKRVQLSQPRIRRFDSQMPDEFRRFFGGDDFFDRFHFEVPSAPRGFEQHGLGTGVIVANFFGRHLVGFWEQLLSRIPLVRSIYSGVKQVAATVLSGSGQSFNKVVLVEYPRRDAWTLAFVTGKAWPGIADTIGADDLVSIYVPTTPNPTSGFFLMVPRKDIREVDMSVDDGLKLILSTGVLTPDEVQAQTGKRLKP